MLGGRRLALNDLHLHRSGQEQLLRLVAVLLWRRLGLVLDWVAESGFGALRTSGHSLVSGNRHNNLLSGNLR